MAERTKVESPFDKKPDIKLSDLLSPEILRDLSQDGVKVESNRLISEECRVTILPHTQNGSLVKRALTEKGFIEKPHKNGAKSKSLDAIVLVKEKPGKWPDSYIWML